eukprot:GEMP01053930.1.p2 GENE.GEMP01053930.1~~GEMP01053930.1.p2  ORF type:complete len:199 (+),score=44.85 GEMP01053930.1:347-943(+)
MAVLSQHSTKILTTSSSNIWGGPSVKIDNLGERMREGDKRLINRVFKVIDSDKSGYIDGEELKTVLRTMGFERQAIEACDRIFDNIGSGTEKISANEFFKIMSKKLDGKNEDEVEKCFTAFINTMHTSTPKSGNKEDFITPETLQIVARSLGETLDLKTAKDMINLFEAEKKDDDVTKGKISLAEFGDIMKMSLSDDS